MTDIKTRFKVWLLAITLIALGFGFLTIREGGTVLFGGPTVLAAAGNVVPFVLWFNFIAGFAYAIAGAGLWMQRRWAAWLALAIAAATAVTFVAFAIYVLRGGAYENGTVIAMTLRTLVWGLIAVISWRLILQHNSDGVSTGVRRRSHQ